MGFEQIWLMGVWTVVTLGLVIGAAYFLRSLRGRIVPSSQRRDRGEALAELHRLQSEMKKKLEEGEEIDSAGEPSPSETEPLPSAPVGTSDTSERRSSPPKKPMDPDAKAEAIAQLQALQAKMRKRLEEDRAREAAAGGIQVPPDVDPEDDDLGS
jgi:hypothetical protein